MLVETVVATLALGRIGAIFTPIFSGYGAPAVATRLRDCEASVLVTADGFLRRSAVVPMKAIADEAVALAPTVRRTLVVRRLGDRAPATPWHPERDRWWDEAFDAAQAALIDEGGGGQLPATDPEAPYMLIYTSGTTGQPKGAVHVHGGFPIKAAQDLAHTFDLRPGDALFWFTDLGWMMGPWAISGALLLGARLILYEGAPDFPGPDRLWELAARHGVTHLGLSPTVVRALIPHGTEPVRSHDLSSLRVLGSTGEPWDPESWWWYFREVGAGRCPIVNYSGGTEVSGGIVGCNLLTPIKPASFNGPCVGTAADVVDGAGRSLRGEVGELVIRAPQPGMTRGFWLDPDRYVESYWSRIPGTWVHGDWAIVDGDGYWYIRGGRGDGPPERRRGGRDRGPARGQGRGDRRRLHAPERRDGRRCAARSDRPAGRRRPRQDAEARDDRRRARPAEDPIGQDHATRGPGGLARARPRRPVGARRPDDDRGDPPGRSDGRGRRSGSGGRRGGRPAAGLTNRSPRSGVHR
jgi:acetyl-CoA synthetase